MNAEGRWREKGEKDGGIEKEDDGGRDRMYTNREGERERKEKGG